MNVAPIVITFTNQIDGAEKLVQSAHKFGWHTELLITKGPYPGANKKFKTIIQSIPRLRDRGYTHIVSVDAFDTLVFGNTQAFLGKLHDHNWPSLVIAAETNLYPDKSRLHEYPDTKTRYKFINSPFILDITKSIPEGFTDIGEDDDQRHMCNWYLDKGQFDKTVVLDSNCDFFQPLYGVDKSVFKADLQNKETGSYPIFFHGNGHADMSWLPTSNDARILIGIPSAGYQRHSRFLDSISYLKKPEYTKFSFAHGQSPAQARNMIIREALGGGYTHILFIDDDVLVPENTIERLLSHDKDMVSGLYLIRKWPHQPIIFLEDNHPSGKPRWRCLEKGDTGLIPITAAGLGCALIKTKVFAALPDPWITLGDPDPTDWCDDIPFFLKAKAKGFHAYCDTTVRCGHMGQLIVWPHEYEGKWHTILDTQAPKSLNIPQLTFQEFKHEADAQAESLRKS